MSDIKPGVYMHSKTGRKYLVHYIAKHEKTLEKMVVYEALEENLESRFWVRSLSEFTEYVEIDGKKVPRFIPSK